MGKIWDFELLNFTKLVKKSHCGGGAVKTSGGGKEDSNTVFPNLFWFAAPLRSLKDIWRHPWLFF